MQPNDLSIGQRLSIGIGVFILVFGALLALVMHWDASSAAAQREYSERIAPLRDRVSALEREIYRVGLAFRSVLLSPTAARTQIFSDRVDEARTGLATLAAAPMSEADRHLYSKIAQLVQAYLQTAESLAEQRTKGPIDTNAEPHLAQLREQLLERTTELGELQAERAAIALAHIAEIRERTRNSLIGAALAGFITFLIIAWLTARSISEPTRRLVRTVAALEHGDWKPALLLAPQSSPAGTEPVRDEMQRLANAFGGAAVALEAREQRLLAKGRVAKAVASSLDRKEVCERALTQIIEHVGAQVGVIYITRRNSTQLEPIASYALGESLPTLQVGEGIPGQAARERQAVLLTNIPPDTDFRVRIGYGSATPKTIAAVPLLFGDALHGVLLVGSLHDFTRDHVDFMDGSALQLGIGLQNAAAYEEIQDLLAVVRESHEEIQAQNEELQAQNEEIQAQSEEIQAQHEEIHAQNEELVQQSDELRRHTASLLEADERKNKFLGVLAHELRNPMAPISNSIYILKHSPAGSDRAQRAQEVIERQAKHLVRLIDDLLDVTRITEGKIHIQREPLDLVDVVRTCVEDLAAAYEQSNVSLTLDLPIEPVNINGDRTRLCQVLSNLLNNSIKFSERGGTVKLELRVDHLQGAAVVRVIDNGIGMEADLLPVLFQPFSQGISGLARTKGGLGLGLALVKTLVSMHEGTVAAHSDGPGCGAEFTVRLPLATGDESLQAQTLEHASQAAVIERASVRRILVIEDNLDAARSLRDALESDRYEIVVAHSGPDGIAKAKSFRPDVVLCDIGLPDMDGYQVARELRAHADTRAAILIALTGYALPPDKMEAQSAGFDLHLAKPLQVAGFTRILAEIPRGAAAL